MEPTDRLEEALKQSNLAENDLDGLAAANCRRAQGAVRWAIRRAEESGDDEQSSNDTKRSLREELAALEHQQWVSWSKEVADGEDISDERIERWREHWVPYEELDEDVKDHDRRWADHVLDVLAKRSVIPESDHD